MACKKMLAGLLILLPLLVIHVGGGDIECAPGKESCQDCYAKLLSQITDRDENYFNLQKAFLPPDKSSPVFVTVYYQFGGSCSAESNDTKKGTQLVSNDTKVWFWSNTIFYLMQPLHVLQFTSVFFSETRSFSSEVCLVLDPECYGASDDFMKLLTQRLNILAIKSVSPSPINDRNNPIAESVETWRKWYQANQINSAVIIFNFTIFPPLTWVLIVFAVFYYNDASPNSRLSKYFSGQSELQEREQKYHLQNEIILSSAAVMIAFIFSCCAAMSALDTENQANKEVAELYSCASSCLIYALPFILLVQDGFIFSVLLLFVLIAGCRQCLQKKLCNIPKVDDRNVFMESGRYRYQEEVRAHRPKHFLSWWRFFAYCMIFSLCCLANHLHYIIIAFVHDLRHATATTLIFGGIFVLTYLALKGLPHITSLTLILCCHLPSSKPNYRKRILLIGKFVLTIVLALYIAVAIALHFFIPDDTGFEDAVSNVVTITTTSGAVVAIVTYLIIKPLPSSGKNKISNETVTTLHQEIMDKLTQDDQDACSKYILKPSFKKLDPFEGVKMKYMACGQPLTRNERQPPTQDQGQILTQDETNEGQLLTQDERQPPTQDQGQILTQDERQPLNERQLLTQGEHQDAVEQQPQFGEATVIIKFINTNLNPILLEFTFGEKKGESFSILLPHDTPKVHKFACQVNKFSSLLDTTWKVRCFKLNDKDDTGSLSPPYKETLPCSLFICKVLCTQETFVNLYKELKFHKIVELEGQYFNDVVEATAVALNMTVVEQTINFATFYGKSIRSDDICILLFKEKKRKLKANLRGSNKQLIAIILQRVTELFPLGEFSYESVVAESSDRVHRKCASGQSQVASSPAAMTSGTNIFD